MNKTIKYFILINANYIKSILLLKRTEKLLQDYKKITRGKYVRNKKVSAAKIKKIFSEIDKFVAKKAEMLADKKKYFTQLKDCVYHRGNWSPEKVDQIHFPDPSSKPKFIKLVEDLEAKQKAEKNQGKINDKTKQSGNKKKGS